MWEFIEFCATVFNISSNIVMLTNMLLDHEQKVPKKVIILQICGNVSWIISSLLRHDPYLCLTASSSMCIQVATLISLTFAIQKNHNSIPAGDSSEELPSFHRKT